MSDKLTHTVSYPALHMPWRRILFFVSNSLILIVSLIFFYGTYQQLAHIEANIEQEPVLHLDSVMTQLHRSDLVSRIDADIATYAMLEAYTIQNRYHRSQALVVSQLWIKYLGFLTGMILSFMGGFFVVARYREANTSLDASYNTLKVVLLTSSPGFFLVFMGTVLMLSTILMQGRTETKDAPTYLIPRIITSKQFTPVKPDTSILEDSTNADSTLTSP